MRLHQILERNLGESTVPNLTQSVDVDAKSLVRIAMYKCDLVSEGGLAFIKDRMTEAILV